jgi:hypothetical protein
VALCLSEGPRGRENLGLTSKDLSVLCGGILELEVEMRKLSFAILSLSFLTISFVGCSTKIVKSTVVSGITRVFMHEPGHFTFIVQNTETKILGQLRVEVYSDQVTMLEDLRDDESVRVEYFCGFHREQPKQCKPIPTDFSNWNLHASQLTIHLHSAKELDGGGWNHGKFGRGQTVVVQ